MRYTKTLGLLTLGLPLLLLAACGNDSQQQTSVPSDSAAVDAAPAVPDSTRPADSLAKTAQATQQAIAEADRYADDVARLLAGLAGRDGNTLAKLESLPSFTGHRKWFDNGWAAKEKRFNRPLSSFLAKNTGAAYTSAHTAFYPFSGADFLTVNLVYPQANKYVLFGLEPAGRLPELRGMGNAQVAGTLDTLQKSLYELLLISFFKTDDMRVEFRTYGTAPVLLAFLARTGHRVLAVRHVQINANGKQTILDAPPAKPAPTAESVHGLQYDIVHEASGTRKTLEYYSVDAADGNMQKQDTRFASYLRSLKPANTYVKSASYLMYKPYFSKVRGLVLDVSQNILQDDSGMPYKSFDPKQWDVKLFGVYDGPIGLFANHYQQDLRAAYKADTSIQKLGFQIGYDRESNLLLARRK